MDRRAFLLAAAALTTAHSRLAHALAASERAAYLGARLDADGKAFVSAFDSDGAAVLDVPIAHRGHSFAIHPTCAQIVAPARRPGTVMHVIDLERKRALMEVASPPGRHFCGHAVFSTDGALLFATETDYHAGRGVIGVYNADRGYAREAEYESRGLDPHDIRMLRDGVLVVANGGILTHPDAPNANLDPEGMDPSLVYLAASDGRVLEQVRLPRALYQLSIRHLAVGRGGTVAIAMQYEGPSGDRVPLVATHVRGAALRLLDVPAEVLPSMRNYCGSATVDADGQLLAVSCPKGNRSMLFDLQQSSWITSVDMPDGCGIAAEGSPGTFILSSGLGGAARFNLQSGARSSIPGNFVAGSRWDNHLIRLPAVR